MLFWATKRSNFVVETLLYGSADSWSPAVGPDSREAGRVAEGPLRV